MKDKMKDDNVRDKIGMLNALNAAKLREYIDKLKRDKQYR